MRLKIIICSVLCLLPAFADGDYKDEDVYPVSDVDSEEKANYFINRWIKFSGNFGFVTNYVSRGQTQTFDGPAAQGEFIFTQNGDGGFYLGVWGSNIDGTTASNGAGLELDGYFGYLYNYNPDIALSLELREAWYPKAYSSLPTRDRFDTLDLIPKVRYKIFTFLFDYSILGVSGVNQNFAQTYTPPLKPNGNSKGSWYVELSTNFPIPNTDDKLNLNLSWGYLYVKNYTSLNYNVFGAGLNYKLPESWAGLVVSASGTVTTANRKYYRRYNDAGNSRNIAAPHLWLGLKKQF